MARIETLSLLDTEGAKEYLAELYGTVIQNVQKSLISANMKNVELSGDPKSGTVEAKRFANAVSQAYGTARAAGAGNVIRAKPVTVAIDTDRELVEELEEKDARLYGVDAVLERYASNHVLRMAAELDRAFFECAATNANSVTTTETDINEILEVLIQECETVDNDFVDGVPRSMMHLVLSPAYYGKIRNNLDVQTNNANINTAAEEFLAWHGVDCKSCVHLPTGTDALLLVTGAVAQPVMADGYGAEKVPLSNAWALELFYHYGTAAVMPDLIFTVA